MVTSTAPVKVPVTKEVRDLLEDLLGRECELAPGVAPYAPSPRDPGTYAVYVDDTLTVRAVVVLDLPLSAHVGAAIGLLPVDAATTAVEERNLTETMKENLGEVFNICSALMNAEGLPHVKLHAVHHVGESTPPNVPGLARVLGRRLDLMAKVAGYGAGRISVVVIAG